MAESGFDVLIVGGGMVGASLACALAQLPLRIGVLEAVPPGAAAQPSFDEKTTAISPGSRRIFAAIGAWPGMADNAEAIHHIHVSERGRFGVTRIDSREQGVEALGYVIPNRIVGQALFARLDRLSNVELLCPAQVEAIEFDDESATVTAVVGDKRQWLSAALVVGADGGRSRVRRALGIEAHRNDYRQSAVIAVVQPARPQRAQAYERFSADGPLALLPMDASRYALIWTLDPAQARATAALPADRFLAALQAAFGSRLGAFTQVGGRQVYPLGRVLSERSWRERGVLIGNAAHSLHPVAGQGFNLGLRDVAVLAEVITDTLAAGEDIGGARALQRYENMRKRDQARVSWFTDRLVRLFANPLPGLGALRSAGLLGLDMLPPAKRWLARRNMGADGHISRLARGLQLREDGDV